MSKTKIQRPFIITKLNENTVKSVVTPPAQYTKQCVELSPDVQEIVTKVNNLIASEKTAYPMRVLLSVMMDNALRVSEVIRISHYDIDNLGRICIKGMKGSADRIITSSRYKEYFLRCKSSQVDPFGLYNRYFLYRFFKNNGLILQFDKGTRNAVTHALRYISIKEMKQAGYKDETKQRFTGHKSRKNVEYYENKK